VRVKAWLDALWVPVVLAVLVRVTFASPVTHGVIGVPSDGFRPPADQWHIPGAGPIGFVPLALVAAWAGWRVVRRHAGGGIGASLAGALVGLITLFVVPVTWCLIQVARVPDFYSEPYRDAIGMRLESWMLIVYAAFASLGWLGGRLATRSRRAAPA